VGHSLHGPMLLRLSDASYTDRLATFLRSLGQTVLAAGPGKLEVTADSLRSGRGEVAIYLRVWSVLYPDAEVQIGNGDDADEDDGDVPAA
jgi:hypothetical protein